MAFFGELTPPKCWGSGVTRSSLGRDCSFDKKGFFKENQRHTWLFAQLKTDKVDCLFLPVERPENCRVALERSNMSQSSLEGSLGCSVEHNAK